MEKTKEMIMDYLYSGEFVGVFSHPPKKLKDVINASTRFYDKWNKKGYGVDVIGVIDGALQAWCVCKESKWEHAYQTLYQHLNENRVCYLTKYDF